MRIISCHLCGRSFQENRVQGCIPSPGTGQRYPLSLAPYILTVTLPATFILNLIYKIISSSKRLARVGRPKVSHVQRRYNPTWHSLSNTDYSVPHLGGGCYGPFVPMSAGHRPSGRRRGAVYWDWGDSRGGEAFVGAGPLGVASSWNRTG